MNTELPSSAIGSPSWFLIPLCISLSPGAQGQLPEALDLQSLLDTESALVLSVVGDDEDDGLGADLSNGVAFGDVNGDGLDDLIVGAWRARPGSPARTEAGVAYVVYGSTDSPFSPVNLNTPASAPISDAGETRIYGDDDYDHMGFSVASGDVNGDGFDDILIGAPGADAGLPEREDSGVVYIVYGDRSLPGEVVNLDTRGEEISDAGETRILGDDLGDEAGYSLAAGDFNGDGFDDLLIGARLGDPGFDQRTDAGEACIVYGSALLPGTVVDLSTSHDSISPSGETRILGDDEDDQAGFAVAAGDVNGDGFDDAVIGAPESDPGRRDKAGEVYVVYGHLNLPGTVVDLDTTGDATSDSGETRILGDDTTDRAGASLATGDLNRDGFDDLLIGAPDADPEGGIDAGEAYVLYGAPSIENTVLDLDTPGDTVSAVGETRILGDDGEDRLGFSVASSDINGDGLDDAILGAPWGDRQGSTDSGETVVVYWSEPPPGTANGTGTILDLDLESTSADVLVVGAHGEDYFGHGSEAGGDFDRDGFAEFAASALEGDNPDSESLTSNEGYAVAVFGSGITTSASAVERFRPGFAPKRGVGGRLSPVIRTWLSFNGGQGPAGGESSVTAEVTRSKAGIVNLGNGSLEDVADVYWKIHSDRTGFATAEVVFQYTDTEIDGLSEKNLRLYQATRLTGPWSQVTDQSVDVRKNEINAEPLSFSYFAIMEEGMAVLPTSLWWLR